MADKSAIEWTDATWNPIRARNVKTGKIGWFCTHASEGCRNCYAEGFNARLGTGIEYLPQALKAGEVELFLDETMLMQPLRWKKPRRVFVCSMTDLFADFVPDAWLDRVYAIMALASHHTFQVLTKRAARMCRYLTDHGDQVQHDRRARITWARAFDLAPSEAVFEAALKAQGMKQVGVLPWPLPNVWAGVSAEDQPNAEDRLSHLRATPAAKRFISAEPLLGSIVADLTGIDWVIVGGESGAKARPMHPDWARDLRDACAVSGTAFFFKQWGAWVGIERPGDPLDAEVDEDGRVEGPIEPVNPLDMGVLTREGRFYKQIYDPVVEVAPFVRGGSSVVIKLSKKMAGRLLDGVEHNAMPELR